MTDRGVWEECPEPRQASTTAYSHALRRDVHADECLLIREDRAQRPWGHEGGLQSVSSRPCSSLLSAQCSDFLPEVQVGLWLPPSLAHPKGGREGTGGQSVPRLAWLLCTESDSNSTHIPRASELTATSVLKGEKEGGREAARRDAQPVSELAADEDINPARPGGQCHDHVRAREEEAKMLLGRVDKSGVAPSLKGSCLSSPRGLRAMRGKGQPRAEEMI